MLMDLFGNNFTGAIINTLFWNYIPNPQSTDETFIADLLSDTGFCRYTFTYDLFRGRDAVLDVLV